MDKRCLVLVLLLLASPLFAGAEPTDDLPINDIALPRMGFPAFTTPNGTLHVEVLGQIQGEWSFHLQNEISSFQLEPLNSSFDQSTNASTVYLLLNNIDPGLYSLVVRGDGRACEEPNCVSVREAWELPLVILWLSDTHYDNSRGQEHLQAGLTRDIWFTNFFRPDFVLHTGDVCNNPPEKLFRGAYLEFQALDVPIILIPGNHDHARGRDLFTKYFAPSNASLDVGPIHFISLDTGPGSMNGDITWEQLNWIERDLERSREKPIKILLQHHPLHGITNTSRANVTALISVLKKHDVAMVLAGHMHYNEVFKEPILHLVNPNTYSPDSGFRILNVSREGVIEWRYAGTEDPIPIWDIDVRFYQANDGLGYGSAVSVVNELATPVVGRLRLRLKAGDELKIEGASLERRWDLQDYLLLDLRAELDSGESRVVKAYTKPDEQPPSHFDGKWEVEKGPTVTVIKFNWTVRDEVLGVEEAEMMYSLDNKTWEALELLRLNADRFLGKLQLGREASEVYFFVKARDPEGREGKSDVTRLVLEARPPETPPTPGRSGLVVGVAVAAAAGIAVFLVFILLRRKRAE